MAKIKHWIMTGLILLLVYSCSKRNHPDKSNAKTDEIKKTEVAKKSVTNSSKKTAVPKVIIVNDKVAKKSIDGRYYYDLNGHRYWRNNKDGKYYLFNKSMYTDDAFRNL